MAATGLTYTPAVLEGEQAAGEPRAWRSVVAARLTTVTFGLTLLVVLVLATGLGTGSRRGWWALGLGGAAALVALRVRRSATVRQRAVAVVGMCLLAATLGYARFGITPGPALGLALAVLIAGLLLGRRAMYVTFALAAVAIAVVGTLMVRGTLAPPAEADISPLLAGVWLRTSIFTLIATFFLAAAVTWVVEQIEISAARAEQEMALRSEAERKGLDGQQAELLGQVAAGLAHDVNNHLAVISMWSSVLLQSRAQDDIEEASDEIAAAIDQATALTRKVLVLGRRGVHKPRPLSLHALVDGHGGTLRRMLGSHLALEIEDEPAPAWCNADEGQLDQVLLNLVMNARDAMPDRGTVTVRTGAREQGGVARVFVEVTDTGVGMTEAIRRRAIEPFFSTKPPGKGSGLGLAAVAAIVRQSAGELLITSTPGDGTTVTVYLPAIAAPAPLPAAKADDAAAPMRLKVLLVDDSPALVQVARRTLQAAGCTVVVAGDGDEAMQRIGEDRFDLLCSDVVMPGRPISDIIAAFQAENAGSPVLLCSGYVGEELVRRGIEAGRYRFLAKPYGPAQLIAEVADLVRAPAPASSPVSDVV